MPVKFNIGNGVSAGKDTATEADVRKSKTFHSGKGSKARVGGIIDCLIKKVVPSSKTQKIPAGSYIAEDIIITGDEALTSKNIRAGTSIFGVDGEPSVVDTSGGNLVADSMLEGQKGYSNGKEINGTIETLTDGSFSPADATAYNDCKIVGSAENVNVGAFDYALTGYIAGKIRVHIANLLSKNIRAGVKVGGIGGYLLGTFTKDATATRGDVLSGKTVGINGEMQTGSMPNRGNMQVSKNIYFYTHTDGRTYLVNWFPEGFYKGFQTGKGDLCAEVWVEKKYVENVIGRACISAMATRNFGATTSDWNLSDEESFTMPRDGIVYYGGMSASYDMVGNIVCEILKNGSVVDHRNIDAYNRYYWRGSMWGKSFAAKKGDIISVIASVASGRTDAMSCIQATIIY